MIEPLRLTYDIDCAPEHAFRVWSERFGTWWPRGHTVSGAPDTEVILEPRVGGRIFERASDGTEIDWGEVTGWDAPCRIAYRWHIRRDPSDATDVLLEFVARSDGTTQLVITHTGWERLGAEDESWRDANAGGWNGLLPHFVGACLTGS